MFGARLASSIEERPSVRQEQALSIWIDNHAVADGSPLVAGLIVGAVCDVISVIVYHHRLIGRRKCSHRRADCNPGSDSGGYGARPVIAAPSAPPLIYGHISIDVNISLVRTSGGQLRRTPIHGGPAGSPGSYVSRRTSSSPVASGAFHGLASTRTLGGRCTSGTLCSHPAAWTLRDRSASRTLRDCPAATETAAAKPACAGAPGEAPAATGGATALGVCLIEEER